MSEKASKGRFCKSPRSSKITVTREKERRKRKSEEKESRRKNFGRQKGPFGGNVIKNPTRRFCELSSIYAK